MADHAIAQVDQGTQGLARPVDNAAGRAGGRVQSERLERAFRAEQLAGLKLATKMRVVALAAVAVMLFFIVPVPMVFYYEGLLAVFIVIGFVHYWLCRGPDPAPWLGYLFVTLDMALMSYTLVSPNPFGDDAFALQMQLRNGLFLYYFLLIAAIAFTYSPRLMLWAGFSAVVCWGIGVAWLISLPDTTTNIGHTPAMSVAELQALHLQATFVDLDARIQEVVVMLLVVGALAGVVWRSRRLVIDQAASARERANLARYFPPTIVDQLAELDQPLGTVRSQPVAVMFVDIVGFTRLAERQEPAVIVALLRRFHGLMERAIFDHDGTLDKFLGDGVMCTFGTPAAGPHDAANAFRCARAMVAAIEAWNAERRAAGEAPIRLSIGIHYGEVVLGDIGSERRLEFAVLGDVVNVASRLEESTRELASQVVVSDDLVRRARDQAGEGADTMLADLRAGPPQKLRGREEPVAVWTLPAETA